MDLKQHIRHVPDFPKAGILFYDITTLLREPMGFKATIDTMALPYMDQRIDAVVGIESRGFILGAAVAQRIGAGFIPIRKPGKLPAKARKAILEGSDHQVHVRYKNRYGRTRSYYADFEGVLAFLQRRMEQTDSEQMKERYEGFMRDVPLHSGHGTSRMKPS